MIEVFGDLWEYEADVRVITTNGTVKRNGECVMGRGCALEAKNRFPGIARKLGGLIQSYGNRPFQLPFESGIVSFPVKHHWHEKADVYLIRDSAEKLVEMADEFGWDGSWNTVVLPRPGCGNGQLSWFTVKPYIEEVLDDRFHVITFP